MSKRTIWWLALALVVLALLAVVGQRRNAPNTPESEAVLLPGLKDTLDQVDNITVRGGGNTPIVTLDRGENGWTVRERDGYRADLTKVRHTLLSLAEATVLESKTSNPGLHAMLGVEDIASPDAKGLAVTLDGSTDPITVIVGEEAGDYRRYVRREGDNQSYLINRDPEIGTDAADWVDASVIDLAPARVRSVTVTHPDGEVVRITKSSSEDANFNVEDVPEGRTLLYDSVANVMASVFQGLTLEDVERDTGDKPEGAIVTETSTFDGLTITALGFERGDGKWITLSAAAAEAAPTDNGTDSETGGSAAEAERLNARLGGWRFRIPAYKFDQLTRNMSDLLQAQP